LKESPFVRSLIPARKAKVGKMSIMAIQFEDCLDCLSSLYGDVYEFNFLFDNSSRHNEGKKDGLSAWIGAYSTGANILT